MHNVLDYSYRSHQEIPRILGDFADHCVDAAKQNVKYCPLARKSLHANNPGRDVLQRINYVIGNLTTSTYKDPSTLTPVSLYFLSLKIRTYLMAPWYFPILADYFLQVETLIRERRPTHALANEQSDKRRSEEEAAKSPTNTTITTKEWDHHDPLIGKHNALAFSAVNCLDMSSKGINTTESFVDYLSYQIDNGNPLVAYEGIDFADCLSWPDLSTYNLETPIEFPSTLRNKILVVGITDDPVTPYTDAWATYNMIGSDNANFMIHDAFGHCTLSNENTCTSNNLKRYFVNGIPVLRGCHFLTSRNNSG